jgi:hypothetical protein
MTPAASVGIRFRHVTKSIATNQLATAEHYGPHDDVVVSMRYDLAAVRVIKNQPARASAYLAGSHAWCVHPSFARELATDLTRIGCTVVDWGSDE